MRTWIGLALLLALVGCGGVEKAADTSESGSASAKQNAASSAAKTEKSAATSSDSSSKASITASEKGDAQVVTYQAGDEKITVKSDGDKMTVVSSDGKRTTVDLAAAKKLGEMMGAKTQSADGSEESTDDEPAEESRTESVEVSSKNEAMTIESDDGTVVIGDQQAPKDFPLPLYKDAKVDYSSQVKPSGEDQEEIFQLHLSTNDAPEAVARFYEQQLKDKGLETQRIDQKMGGLEMITVAGESTSGEISASAQTIREGADQPTRIILMYSIRKE